MIKTIEITPKDLIDLKQLRAHFGINDTSPREHYLFKLTDDLIKKIEAEKISDNQEEEYKDFSKWWEKLTENNNYWKTLERMAAFEAWKAAKEAAKKTRAKAPGEPYRKNYKEKTL